MPAGAERETTTAPGRPRWLEPRPQRDPGGAEVFAGPEGRSWVAYHAWAEGEIGYPNPRRLYLAELGFYGDRPVLTAHKVGA